MSKQPSPAAAPPPKRGPLVERVAQVYYGFCRHSARVFTRMRRRDLR